MLDEATFAAWLESYGRAWQEGDPALIVDLFTADAAYFEVPFDAPIVGREAIRHYWTVGAQQSQTAVTFTYRILGVRGNDGVAHWKATFTRLPSRNRVRLDGILLATFDREGKCRVFREWWHRQEEAPLPRTASAAS